MIAHESVVKRLPLEEILLTDCFVNFFILLCVQSGTGSLCVRRLLASVLIMTTDTISTLICPGRLMRSIPVQSAFCLSAAAVLCGSIRMQRVIPTALCILCATFMCAGMSSLWRGHLPFTIPAAVIGFYSILRKRMHIRNRWNIEIYVEKCGVHDIFPALIDTGNQLTDPYSGQPVLIAESAALPNIRRILPGVVCRPIPFGVLGGGGTTDCFKPDRVLIRTDDGDFPAPGCRIAVYNGKIPGRIRALAPPSFMDPALYGKPRSHSASKEIRRI